MLHNIMLQRFSNVKDSNLSVRLISYEEKKVKESDLLSLFLKSLPLGHEQVNPDMEFSIPAKL